ncbi:MAG: DUF2279 domain-containing protein [Chitinophagaceae bacterium]
MPSDSLNTKRLIGVSCVQAGIWASSMYALNKAWYSNYPRSSFHLFNDIGEWQQVDKVGHAWSAYLGAQFSTELFRWSGMNRKKSALLGGGVGIAFESVIEILDGYSSKWGFSLSDMAANTSGSLIFSLQEFAWQEQRIQFKFSAHKNYYQDPQLLLRANDLYGHTLANRILKDYNAQTYWLSANISSFVPNKSIPAWLNIAVGYGATGMFGGYTNTWEDENQNTILRNDIKRIRQFYISPDIDLSKIKIKGKNPFLLKALNSIKLKIPMPALELNSQGQVRFHGLFF